MAKRTVFISYHHTNEQKVVDDFIETFSEDYEVFTDSSLQDAADSDDTAYLNQVCCDKIKGTSVTIVMVGKKTGCRKYVDWEIRYTLACKHGLGITRLGLAGSDASVPERLNDNIESGYAKWYKYPSSAAGLKSITDEAFDADTDKIENSRLKMKRNT